jgi:chromosome segregation ATPase
VREKNSSAASSTTHMSLFDKLSKKNALKFQFSIILERIDNFEVKHEQQKKKLNPFAKKKATTPDASSDEASYSYSVKWHRGSKRSGQTDYVHHESNNNKSLVFGDALKFNGTLFQNSNKKFLKKKIEFELLCKQGNEEPEKVGTASLDLSEFVDANNDVTKKATSKLDMKKGSGIIQLSVHSSCQGDEDVSEMTDGDLDTDATDKGNVSPRGGGKRSEAAFIKLEEDKEELEEEILILKKKIREFETLQQNDGDDDGQIQVIQDLQKERDSLSQKLRASQMEVEQLREEKDKAVKEIQLLKTEEEKKSQSIKSKFKNQMKDLKTKVQDLGGMQKFKEQVDQLEKENGELKTQVNTLDSTVKTLRVKLQEEMDKKKEESESESESEDDSDTESDASEKKKKPTPKKPAPKKKKKDDSDDEDSDDDSHDDLIRKEMESINADLESKVKSLEKSLKDLQTTHDKLKSDNDAKVKELEQKIKDLKRKGPDSDDDHEEINGLKKKVTTLESEKKTILQNVAKFEIEVKELKKSSSEDKKKYETKIQELEDSIKKLKSTSTPTTPSKNNKKVVSDSDSDDEDLIHENDQLKKTIIGLETEKKGLKSQINELQGRVDELKDIEIQLTTIQTEKASKSDVEKKYQEKERKYKEDIKQLKSTEKEVRAKLDLTQQQMEEQSIEIEERDREISRLKRTLKKSPSDSKSSSGSGNWEQQILKYITTDVVPMLYSSVYRNQQQFTTADVVTARLTILKSLLDESTISKSFLNQVINKLDDELFSILYKRDELESNDGFMVKMSMSVLESFFIQLFSEDDNTDFLRKSRQLADICVLQRSQQESVLESDDMKHLVCPNLSHDEVRRICAKLGVF